MVLERVGGSEGGGPASVAVSVWLQDVGDLVVFGGTFLKGEAILVAAKKKERRADRPPLQAIDYFFTSGIPVPQKF